MPEPRAHHGEDNCETVDEAGPESQSVPEAAPEISKDSESIPHSQF